MTLRRYRRNFSIFLNGKKEEEWRTAIGGRANGDGNDGGSERARKTSLFTELHHVAIRPLWRRSADLSGDRRGAAANPAH